MSVGGTQAHPAECRAASLNLVREKLPPTRVDSWESPPSHSRKEAPQKLARSPWQLTHHRTIAETKQRCKTHFMPPWQALLSSYNQKATGTLVPGHTPCLSVPDAFERGLFLHVVTRNYRSRSKPMTEPRKKWCRRGQGAWNASSWG